MRGRILVVEGTSAVARAIAVVLERRGYTVTLCGSCAEASRHPGTFDCGVFADKLSDGNGMSLAGWLLAEDRVRSVVFFGDSFEIDTRLRAANLGSFVHKSEGLHELERAIADAIADSVRAVAAGAEHEAPSFRTEIGSGPRRLNHR
jgi:DNA-binding response OmpR family regulator